MQLPATAKQRARGDLWRRVAAGIILLALVALTVQKGIAWFKGASEKSGAPTAAARPQSSPTSDSASPSASTSLGENRPTTAVPAANLPDARPGPTTDADPTQAKIVLESRGYLVPAHQILVSPKVQGMVVKLDIEEGRRVEKGALLAQIESIEYERDLERAVALYELSKARLLEMENGSRPEEIAQAEAELGQAQEEIVDFERTWKRNQELWKSRSVTEQELQKSEAIYLAARRRIDALNFALQLLRKGPREERIIAARAEVKQYEADVRKAEWRLGNCTIRAPISGTILKKNAEEGNLVNSMALQGNFSLCEMADLSDLEVDLAIQERDVSNIFIGQMCRVRSEAFPKRIYEGYVARLMPIADRAKGAIPVRVKVRVPSEEEGVYLKPEMGANVSFYDARDPKLPAEKK